ncbi:hypothetical protein HPP92_010562 [Vanilla planifolia]|uniref:Uncharacterized protein n=1 Tax=Vanilla planifolia TaxID=51239 RepID=A0A835R9V7_VANPL|nr:hypothetical protein HPP92_010562 [Vanilla planifolia]
MERSTKAFYDQLETPSPNRHSVQPDGHRFTCRCRSEDHSDRDDPTEISKNPGLSTRANPASNRSCIICFFQMLMREFNGLALEEMIPVCVNCKHKIAHFYLHKRHETLGPKDKKGYDKEKDLIKNEPKRGRRRRKRVNRKCQNDIWQRYRNEDPTVGPLGQLSGKFDYLLNYSRCTSEPIRNPIDPTSYNELFIPTGWGEI